MTVAHKQQCEFSQYCTRALYGRVATL